MSSNSRIISLLIVITFSLNLYAKTTQKNLNTTSLMLIAMDYEKANKHKKALSVYMTLLKQENKYEYLEHILSLLLQMQEYDETLTVLAKYKHIFKKNQEHLMRLEISTLLKIKQYTMALNFSYKLLKKYKNGKNYETVGIILYQLKQYKKSLKYFESAYASDQNYKMLLNIVDVLYSYLDKKKLAISYLETYIRVHKCEPDICNRLLIYYQEDKNLDAMVSILKKIYKKYKHNTKKHEALDKVIDTIVEILKINNINNAIKFLEENNIYDVRLLTLYHQNNQHEQALILTKKLYHKTKNVKYLAQLAMLEYETATNKNKILNTVIANFNIVLKTIDEPAYNNYFGYLLIDHNINVKRGIILINKALDKEPLNIAYLDSLAWGYYKLKSCKKAKKIMRDIKKLIVIDDKELKKHYKKIMECK